MATLGYCLQYMLKINLGMAIVCMVNNTALVPVIKDVINSSHYLPNTSAPYSDLNLECPANKESKNQIKVEGTFIWSKSTQGFILASYFYGYIITQV